MSNVSSITFKVNADLKAQANELFNNLGLNTSAVLNMFLTQCVREQQIPFVVSMNSPEPSARLKRALKEVEDDISGKKTLKGYDNMSDLIKALEE